MPGGEKVIEYKYMRIGAWSGDCFLDDVLFIAAGKVADSAIGRTDVGKTV